MLPDDVLLDIFYFHAKIVDKQEFRKKEIEEWIKLVHVCRRWRSLVFQSPFRLNLRLFCTHKTPLRDTLYIWPRLPLIICDLSLSPKGTSGADNIIAALEHNDRVCRIGLRSISSSQLNCVTNSEAIQKPFLQLTVFSISPMVININKPAAILRDSFLGGTAPRLQSLTLWSVTFPGLSKLLLSTTHLVNLDLDYIPRAGYIPPEAMATNLSALTSLESLRLRFQFPRPRPALESQRPPPRPLTRTILPSLTKLGFKGSSEYSEEILARIDTPRLINLDVTFFNQIIFDTPQLFQLISRTPTPRAPKKCLIEFGCRSVFVRFFSHISDHGVRSLKILCKVSEWQLSSLQQVCTLSLPPASTLEDLYITEGSFGPPLRWQDDVENTLWLELLHPFAAVKNLHLCKKFAPRIAPALQELVGGRTTEVLPALENILLEGFQPSEPLHEGIENFVAARQLTSHPVAVSCSDKKQWEIYG